MKDAKLQYKLKTNPLVLDVRAAGDTAKAVMHDFDARRRIFDTIMTIVRRCLAFVFLKIILSAQNYHDKYLTDIEFDNVYVTTYFRKIDARRRTRECPTLLPLRKIERTKLVDPYRTRPSRTERANLIGQTVKLILEMVTATTFVLLDRLFYETLDLVRRHAHIEYTQVSNQVEPRLCDPSDPHHRHLSNNCARILFAYYGHICRSRSSRGGGRVH